MALDYLGIDHLGIAVEDFEQSKSLYGETLGFEISGEDRLPQRGIEVCFVETGNARLELLGATGPDSEISTFLTKRGGGVHHLCVAVADIDKAIAELTERGARIIGDGVQTGAHDTRVAFIHPKSTGGVLLELVEKKPTEEHSK